MKTARVIIGGYALAIIFAGITRALVEAYYPNCPQCGHNLESERPSFMHSTAMCHVHGEFYPQTANTTRVGRFFLPKPHFIVKYEHAYMLSSQELRHTFLDFFKKKGHVIVPSSSLLPDDPSVLLTTAGMQQFKPYYIGNADPIKDFGSKNTVSIQKSFRTSDIDEVGDESHLTFFEMLGNFSFGGYFKKEAIQYGYDFIVTELGLTIDYVTVFGGDAKVPSDKDSRKIWESLGIRDIRDGSREDNFWGPTGQEGPCGPTTEIYVNSAFRQAQDKHPVEVWNIVFNEYYQHKDKK